ncbi:hypothetical protein L3Q82_003485 [Scortum barcoo]|uniref:Uncharacterized protein n=1 Tax=Scortum barcoo TaxID=214431 RepID=A0ACB8VMC4_9TELE|nr:hypothetical protein L3Q82_003485 [Scortum barcoo]
MANALKGSGPLGAGLVQASRSLHTSSQSLAPVPPLPEKGGKVRHGIFPEELFQLLYPKTGVTGPYMLGTGLLVYMLSKEIYVINHETFAAASIGAVIIYGVKKFGPSVAAFADKLNEDKVAKAQEVKDAAMASLTQAIEDEKKEQWRAEGRSMLFDAKRNNVAMLLETNYRERLHMVTNEVKRRLDYQVALQDLHRRMEQEHMVNWVEKSVVSSITAQQRKEYSETLNKHSDNFHVRVEHLLTCELDGQELKTVDACVAKLKRLDVKGRLWSQEMIMEVQGGYLLLTDIETKAELEALPLSSILETTAVLDSCAYNSLLTITMQERNKRTPQVYMFQCEETGAEIIKSDLDKVIQKGGDVELRRDQSHIRANLENIIGQQRSPPPPELPPPQWINREPDYLMPPRVHPPQEAMMHHPDLHELSPEQADMERNTDILNHVINDMETFMAKVSAAMNAASLQEAKSKKKKKKKKSETNAESSVTEKVLMLQGQLNGTLSSPTAADYVHIFFTCLTMVLPLYPADLPPTVLSPLLTEAALQLLSQVVDPQEDQLWTSLGDCWNVPKSRWPNDDIPPYVPEFYDGWQPPAPSRIPVQNGPLSRSSSQRFSLRHPSDELQQCVWDFAHPTEPPLYMRVIYDFMARNSQELSIMKGEVVQVVQKTKQWWLVRNSRDEEGNVPQNVLEPMADDRPMEDLSRDPRGPVTLDLSSTPAEVKAWLSHKGFSKITVSSLGVLNGKLLLGMSKDEIRAVCPEEGGKVFFQLQAIKTAIALASEPSGMYNGRY